MEVESAKHEYSHGRNFPSTSRINVVDSEDKLHMSYSLKHFQLKRSSSRRGSSSRDNDGKKKEKKGRDSSFETGMSDSTVDVEQPFINAVDGLVSLKYYREMEKKLSIALKEKDVLMDSLKKDIKIVEEENVKYKNKILELKEKFKAATTNIISMEEAHAALVDDHNKLQESYAQLQLKEKSSDQQAEEALFKVKHLEDALNNQSSMQSMEIEECWNQIKAKDREIEELQKKVVATGKNVSYPVNSEALAFRKLLSEKDEQIKHLEDKLKDAVLEIEESSKTLLQLKSERSVSNSEMTFSVVGQSDDACNKTEEKNLKKQLEALNHKLSLATEKLRQFERNEYGLHEALVEIEDLKRQVHIRDLNINELVQKINSFSADPGEFMKQSDIEGVDLLQPKRRKRKKPAHGISFGKTLMTESLHRSKLLQPFIKEEMTNKLIKWGKAVRVFRHSSQVLHQEISKLAKQSFIGYNEGIATRTHFIPADLEEKTDQFSDEALSVKSISQREKRNKKENELDHEVAVLSAESGSFQKGTDDTLDRISLEDASSDAKFSSRDLKHLLHVLDHHHLDRRHHTSVRLEAELNSSKCENSALKEEIHVLRIENNETKEKLNTALSRIAMLEHELAVSPIIEFPLTIHSVLSETLSVAKDISHVLGVVDEWYLDEKISILLKEYLKNFHDRCMLVYQQYGSCYQHHMSKTTESEEKRLDVGVQTSFIEVESEVKVEVKVDKKLSVLSVDESNSMCAEADQESGKVVKVAKGNKEGINVVSSTRKLCALEHSVNILRKEKEKLQMHLLSLKLIIIKREENYIRQNEISKHQIGVLTHKLDGCISKSSYEETTKQLNELIIKYRGLLQMSKHSDLNEELIKQQQVELALLREQKENLQEELKKTLQRVHVHETTISNGDPKDSEIHKVTLLSEKLAELEVENLSVKEQAHNAEHVHKTLQGQFSQLQEDYKELQTALTSLEQQNQDLQLKEMQLQDQLHNFISVTGHVNGVSQLKSMEENMRELNENNSKLKERAELAEEKVRSLQQIKSMKDNEAEHLKWQILHLQSGCEDKTLFVVLILSDSTARKQCTQLNFINDTAKINDDILHAHNMLAISEDKVQFLERQIECLNSENINLKHALLGKDTEILSNKKMMATYCRQLLLYILEMRMRYSGANTLLTQEKVYFGHLKLLEECTEAKLQANKLEETLSICVNASHKKRTSEDPKLKVVSDEKLVACLLDKVKICEEKLAKQKEYTLKLENENTLLEKQYESNKLQWENREYGLLKELGHLISPESNRDNVVNEFIPKVETRLKEDSELSHHKTEQEIQVVSQDSELVERWKHDAEVNAQKNIIKELIEQLAKAEFQLNEKQMELMELKGIVSLHTCNQLEKKSVETSDKRDSSVQPLRESSVKDLSLACKITVEALNVILNQKDAVLLRYKKQICDAREAQVNTLLESKMKPALTFVKNSSEDQDPKIGDQKNYQFIPEQPRQICVLPEIPHHSQRMIELQNEVSLQQRKCDYLTVQLNLWESEAHHYKALSEKRQLELEEMLSRQENEQKSWLNASCHFQAENLQHSSFYERKDLLMDSVQEEPSGALAAVDSIAPIKTMVNVGTNTELSRKICDDHVELPPHNKEKPERTKHVSVVKESSGDIDQELETLSNLINNAEEASDNKISHKSLEELKQNSQVKLRDTAGRKINKSILQITMEKLKADSKVLEEQLQNCQIQLETMQNKAELECKRKVELTKWEEGKKWQQTISKLHERLKSEKKTIEDLKKLNSNCRDAVARLQREKTVLENKVKIFKKEKVMWNPDSEVGVEALQKEVLNLKKTIFDLEGINILQKQKIDKFEKGKRKEKCSVKDENGVKNDDGCQVLAEPDTSATEIDLIKEQEKLQAENVKAFNKINKLEEEVKSLKLEKSSLEERIFVFLGKEEQSSMMHNEVNALRLELARKTQLLQAVKGLLRRIHEKTKKNVAQKEDG